MAWAYPVEKFVSSYVLDMEDFNTNLAVFADEADGNLNEHNWSINALAYLMTVSKTVANDIAMRFYDTQTALAPMGALGTLTQLQHNTRWVPIDGMSKTFASPGGVIMVIASFQLRCTGFPAGQSGLNFILEVDGVPQANSLLGTGDQSNEYIDSSVGTSGGTIALTFGTSPSFKAEHEPKMIKGHYRLEPGEHTVRVLARNLFTITAPIAQFVSQRELIILHMWA